MEYNQNFNEEITTENTPVQEEAQAPVFLREKKKGGNTLLYVILALLVLGLLGWIAFAAGWFGGKTDTMIPVEQNNGIGDGALPFDDQAAQMAPIESYQINTLESFPVQKVLNLKGNLKDGCTYLNEPEIIRSGNVFYVTLSTRTEGDVCTQALVPYERNISLDVVGLPAGVYTVIVNGKETSFELAQDNTLDFSAGDEK